MTEAQLIYRAARARWKQEYTDSLSIREIPPRWRVGLARAITHLRAYFHATRAAMARYGLRGAQKGRDMNEKTGIARGGHMPVTVDGKHDFSGACAPETSLFAHRTFSVGVFQWVLKASGKGLKKTKAKVRVFGVCSDPGAVYAEATRICALLDSGEYTGPKRVTV